MRIRDLREGTSKTRHPRVPTRALRDRCVSTKVTAEEHAKLLAAAQGRGFSEWVRDALLDAAVASPIDRVLLAELIAIRAIVLTLNVAIANGETVTQEGFQQLVERADRDKFAKAQDRLAALIGFSESRRS